MKTTKIKKNRDKNKKIKLPNMNCRIKERAILKNKNKWANLYIFIICGDSVSYFPQILPTSQLSAYPVVSKKKYFLPL